MVRLGSVTDTAYNRPKTTYQESLTTEQIKEKLKGYTKVEEVSKIPLHSHVRYFVYQEDPVTKKVSRLFRLGGKLINKDNHEKYVVLSNGRHTWSVNTLTSTFFRQMRPEEIHDKYEDEVERLKQKVSSLTVKLEQAGGNDYRRR